MLWMSLSAFQETSASFAVDKLAAVVGWRLLERQSWLCVEGCFVQSLLNFSLGCQSFPTGCGMYFVCPETLACFHAVSVLENIKKNVVWRRGACVGNHLIK